MKLSGTSLHCSDKVSLGLNEVQTSDFRSKLGFRFSPVRWVGANWSNERARILLGR